MAIVSILVFGGAFVASVYAIFATLRPELARIGDLLANGPVMIPTLVTPVPARSSLRNVRVRSLGSMPRLPLRAAA